MNDVLIKPYTDGEIKKALFRWVPQRLLGLIAFPLFFIKIVGNF
jgi:hypothetical protein